MLIIIIKNIRNQIRNPKWILFLMIFPIFLMYLIGSILSGAFDSKVNVANVSVVCSSEGTGPAKEVIDAITSASVNIEEDYGLVMKRIYSEQKGKDEARVNKKVFVHLDKDEIKVYANESESLNASRVIAVFKSVANSIQVVREIYKVNASLGSGVLDEDNAHYEVPVDMMPDESSMSSYDYYGVAELTLVLLYLALIPLGELFTDRRTKVKDRIRLTGLSNFKYFVGSLIAYSLVAVVTFLPSFIFSDLYLNTTWSANKIVDYLYIMLFGVFNISLGMLIAVLLKERGKTDVILSIVIFPIFSFLGGSYTPFPYDMGGVMGSISYISPLRWINVGLFKRIYANDNNTMIVSSVAFSLLILGIMAFIIWRSRREELSA